MQTVTIPAPSSKSLSHRAIMAASLASGTSHLSRILESDDLARTREAFAALGVKFTRTGDGCYTVTGIDGKITSGSGQAPLSINVGESGTTCRLITAILAAGQGSFRIHGSGRMHERPLGELAEVLRTLGAGISYEQNEFCPPIIIRADGLRNAPAVDCDENSCRISCDESSQYISGLLLAAPLGDGLTVVLGGKQAVSWPYVSLTLNVLEDFGIRFSVQALDDASAQWRQIDWRKLRKADPGKLRFLVEPGTYKARDYAVEGDWSGASYFLAAGAIGPRPVCVTGLNGNSLQGDAALLDILSAMGARVVAGPEGITVFPSLLKGIDVDMGHCPDLVPTVAAVAAHAIGTTRISNVAHLKIKESDRLAAPAEELGKAGCKVEVLDDGLVIHGTERGPQAPEAGVIFSAHNDHRMAMSVSLLGLPGLRRPGAGFTVTLDEPGCVAKSFPHFWTLWETVRNQES